MTDPNLKMIFQIENSHCIRLIPIRWPLSVTQSV